MNSIKIDWFHKENGRQMGYRARSGDMKQCTELLKHAWNGAYSVSFINVQQRNEWEREKEKGRNART